MEEVMIMKNFNKPCKNCGSIGGNVGCGTCRPPDHRPRRLATRIARSLFTNGFGDEGTRLEIKKGDGHGKEIALGGWCFGAAVDQIAKVIEENA